MEITQTCLNAEFDLLPIDDGNNEIYALLYDDMGQLVDSLNYDMFICVPYKNMGNLSSTIGLQEISSTLDYADSLEDAISNGADFGDGFFSRFVPYYMCGIELVSEVSNELTDGNFIQFRFDMQVEPDSTVLLVRNYSGSLCCMEQSDVEVLDDGSVIVSFRDSVDAALFLVAPPEINAPTITFNSTTGTFQSDNTTTKSVQTNLDGTISLSTLVEFPIKQSYVFKGWSTTENGSIVYTPYASPTITEDTTLYAVWEEAESYLVQEDSLVNIANAIRKTKSTTNQLTLNEMASAISGLSTKATLTFSTSHGVTPSDINAYYTKPSNPVEAGYSFLNWYTDSACTEVFDFSSAAETATIYAKWSINDPTVSNPTITGDGTTSYSLGIVTPAGSGQTVYYSEDGNTWSTTCPTKSEKGTYTTYWKITATDCEDKTGSFVTVITVEGIRYNSTLDNLSKNTYNSAVVSFGSYALFAGGDDGSSTCYDTVYAYNTSLTRSTPTALSAARGSASGATVGNYALFAGGSTGWGVYTATVDAYNTSLTRSTPTALSVVRTMTSGATVGNYAIFAGGFGSSIYDTVDAYNTSLTRSTPTALSAARGSVSGATVGNYALFAGGRNGGTYYTTVDAYNTSLTRSTPTALSAKRQGIAAKTLGDYALFAGGSTGSRSASEIVDAYNTSLTRSTPTALSVQRSEAGSATLRNYLLIAGGKDENNTWSSVDMYNRSLARSSQTDLSSGRYGLSGATVGNYAIFAGGDRSKVVDSYIYEN